MDNEIGQRIKYHRMQRNMSQEKLALIAEINPAFLGHLERGLKSPTIKTLDKIVNALGVTYSEFFNDSTDIDITDDRQFYTNMILSSIKRLPDDKLKIAADIVLKLTELID